MDGRSIRTMVCLAIGSMEEERDSRLQFAFSVLLAEHLHVKKSSVMVYDPDMTSKDKALVAKYGFQVGKNELDFDPSLGKRERILYFMPKAPYKLYDTVLRYMTRTTSLANTICLGNSLKKHRIHKTSGGWTSSCKPHI